MINLFTAVIISDLNNLEKDVFVQNLSNMAQCAMLAEAILPNKLLKGIFIRFLSSRSHSSVCHFDHSNFIFLTLKDVFSILYQL